MKISGMTAGMVWELGMDIWKNHRRDRQKQLWRVKCYLLAIGLLILGILLFGNAEKPGEE